MEEMEEIAGVEDGADSLPDMIGDLISSLFG